MSAKLPTMVSFLPSLEAGCQRGFRVSGFRNCLNHDLGRLLGLTRCLLQQITLLPIFRSSNPNNLYNHPKSWFRHGHPKPDTRVPH